MSDSYQLSSDEQYLIAMFREVPDRRKQMILTSAENIKSSHESEVKANIHYGQTSLKYPLRSA